MTQNTAKQDRRSFVKLFATATVGAVVGQLSLRQSAAAVAAPVTFKLSDAEWRKRLSAQAYAVLRRAGTERPYSSPLNDEHRKGRFVCAGCALPLFLAETKFDSGTGWPSFYDHLPRAIDTRTDDSSGDRRTEVHCKRCAGHLGHVFDDGPRPTGLRYCMNGVALQFQAS
jgi:peptide-methionine (R)-S-oxide reductase